jgi:methyl coenzyme M reductase subunit C-like uncharacterized protein (methanogenesis marker protein 7)
MEQETREFLLAGLEVYTQQLGRTARTLHAKGMPEAAESVRTRQQYASTLYNQIAQGVLKIQRTDLAADPLVVSPSTVKNK